MLRGISVFDKTSIFKLTADYSFNSLNRCLLTSLRAIKSSRLFNDITTYNFFPGSCNVVGHITKGMCQALDLAVYGLHVLEQKAYWAEQAVVKAAKNMLVVHSLSFETHLTSTPLDSTVSLGADVSIFGSRGQFKLEFNLADPLKNVHKLADTALEFFKKLFSPRPSKDVYDMPAEESDFEFSGVCARKIHP